MPPTKEQKERSIAALTQMLNLLGLETEVAAKEEGDDFLLTLKTDDPGRLIGRKGYYLDSLELVLNRILRKEFSRCSWVEVDVDGYKKKKRPRRQQSDEETAKLQQMALDAAKEVKRWGQERKIGPFNARARRTVHMTLRDDDEVVTASEPDEKAGLKRVVIRLAQKDDALSQ
jgi:spoIIIJ-associated protein